jgi:plasmid maintenance system antidote protein VapI
VLSPIRKKLSTVSDVAEELPRALMRVPLDDLAAATGRCRRTVSNWFDGKTNISGPDLIAAMSQFDDVTNEVLRLAGKRALTAAQIERLKKVLEDF